MPQISQCPQCGANASPASRKCAYCSAEFFISSIAYLSAFDSTGIQKYLLHYKKITQDAPGDIEGLLGLGLCYLQLNMYPLAQKQFELAIASHPETGHAYYYRCLSLIAGRRVMTLSLKEIRDIEAYVNSAIVLDSPRPHYYILLAIIKHDYYVTNGMKYMPPSSDDLLQSVVRSDLDGNEISRLKESVKVPDYSLFLC